MKSDAERISNGFTLCKSVFAALFFLAVIPLRAQHWYQKLLPDTYYDTLSVHYSQKAFYCSSYDSDSAEIFVAKAFAAARRPDDTAGIYNSRGWILMHKGNYDSAQYYMTLASDIYRREGNILDEIRVTTNMAVIHSRQSHFSEAIYQLLRADSLLMYHYDSLSDYFIQRELGILYRQTGNLEKATTSLQGAMQGFRAIKNLDLEVSTAISLGILYRQKKDYDSSLLILNQGIQRIVPLLNNRYQEAVLYENIAETYYDKRDYNNALKCYKHAYAIMNRLGNMGDIAYEALGIGRSLARAGRLKEAEPFLKEAYSLCDTLKTYNYAYDAAGELVLLYEARENWSEAFKYVKVYKSLGDSMNLYAQRQKFSEVESQFLVQKKDQEISLLNANNEIEKAKSKRAILVMYLIIAAIVIILMVGYIVFSRYRIRQKIQIQEVRNKIAGDLHDDIGSTLSSINMYSQMIRQRIGDSHPETFPLLEKISGNTQETIQNMSDIVWAIKPDNDQFEYVEDRMLNFAVELCTPKGIGLKFTKSEFRVKLRLPMEIRRDLYLIFKEAVNNAVKYSEATEIEISLRKKGQWLKMVVADNGKGFEITEKINKSYGLRGMKTRAALHKGIVEIDSIPGAGTVVTLSIPLT